MAEICVSIWRLRDTGSTVVVAAWALGRPRRDCAEVSPSRGIRLLPLSVPARSSAVRSGLVTAAVRSTAVSSGTHHFISLE